MEWKPEDVKKLLRQIPAHELQGWVNALRETAEQYEKRINDICPLCCYAKESVNRGTFRNVSKEIWRWKCFVCIWKVFTLDSCHYKYGDTYTYDKMRRGELPEQTEKRLEEIDSWIKTINEVLEEMQ